MKKKNLELYCNCYILSILLKMIIALGTNSLLLTVLSTLVCNMLWTLLCIVLFNELCSALFCINHCTVVCSVLCILHCSMHCTTHCTMHCTLHCTLHQATLSVIALSCKRSRVEDPCKNWGWELGLRAGDLHLVCGHISHQNFTKGP